MTNYNDYRQHTLEIRHTAERKLQQ